MTASHRHFFSWILHLHDVILRILHLILRILHFHDVILWILHLILSWKQMNKCSNFTLQFDFSSSSTSVWCKWKCSEQGKYFPTARKLSEQQENYNIYHNIKRWFPSFPHWLLFYYFIKEILNAFPFYRAWSKHLGSWENTRIAGKPLCCVSWFSYIRYSRDVSPNFPSL